MGWLGKQDPLSEREKALDQEISALEAQIKKLNEQQDSPESLKARRTPPPEPVFEPVDPPSKAPLPAKLPAQYYNELGVRKYDLSGAYQRLKDTFKGRPPANPQLVNYLAAGSLQGFRPLRYEKRIARNRFIALTIVLLLFIWGILAALVRW